MPNSVGEAIFRRERYVGHPAHRRVLIPRHLFPVPSQTREVLPARTIVLRSPDSLKERPSNRNGCTRFWAAVWGFCKNVISGPWPAAGPFTLYSQRRQVT